MNSIIIIGGGVAGLMTAFELSKHALPVTVLESKDRLGGRIFTLNDNAFSQPVELGAEFIHGDLPLTLSLLNEAGIAYQSINEKMFHVEKGEFKQQKEFTEDWNKLMRNMHDLKKDMPLSVFLDNFFKENKYAALRESVKSFAGGFDLADISTASTKSLYREWNKEMDGQYRINGGYKMLVDYLESQCKKNGCIIHTNCCVKKIGWQKDEVNMLTFCSRLFKSNKVILTVPLSNLQLNYTDEDYIEFVPSIPEHINAAKNIGFGKVIKIILEFRENFWNDTKKDAGFIFINEEVPTWWTQLPAENAVLTGWIGGAKADVLKDETDEIILLKALQSLANAFDISLEDLKEKMKASKIVNWYREPGINGGYSFNTTESFHAKKVLQKSLSDTIFFAGEALFEGTPVGTVEAALNSGKKTALQVLRSLQ
jgi:monoamine oxidase